MQDYYPTEAQAVRRMANGKLLCPKCGGELLLVEKGLLCVDGECDEIYALEDGKPVFFVTEDPAEGKTFKEPVIVH